MRLTELKDIYKLLGLTDFFYIFIFLRIKKNPFSLTYKNILSGISEEGRMMIRIIISAYKYTVQIHSMTPQS